ncbi:lasso peptide biosynthesis B2 protein [Sphingomonas sp. YL-JM2C]
MFRWRRRAALAWRHGRLLVQCLAVVAAVRIGLALFGYRVVLDHIAKAAPARPSGAHAHLHIWCVKHGARIVPGATCLTQALALHYLRARAGHPTHIRIGVRQRDDGRIAAHAWLVDGDAVLIGGQDEQLARFTPLVDLWAGPR